MFIQRKDILFHTGGSTEDFDKIGFIDLDITDEEMDKLIIEILKCKINQSKITISLVDKKEKCPHCHKEL